MKREHYHAAIVKRNSGRLQVTWVRRAGTHKAMMPSELPSHVRQFLGCDSQGFVTVSSKSIEI